jgi:hypothetical protein
MSLDTARRVLKIEAQAIQDVFARLDDTFEKAVDILFGCKGRVVVTGMASPVSSDEKSPPPCPAPALHRSSFTPRMPSTAI